MIKMGKLQYLKSKSDEKKSVAQSYSLKLVEVTKVGDVEYIVNSKSISQNVGGEYGKRQQMVAT